MNTTKPDIKTTNNDNNQSEHTQHTFVTIVPYEERLQKYNERRNEIFKDFIPEISKKVAKARTGYLKRKTERKEIASACIEVDNDIRPYLNITINGVKFSGLMDSGASVS